MSNRLKNDCIKTKRNNYFYKLEDPILIQTPYLTVRDNNEKNIIKLNIYEDNDYLIKRIKSIEDEIKLNTNWFSSLELDDLCECILRCHYNPNLVLAFDQNKNTINIEKIKPNDSVRIIFEVLGVVKIFDIYQPYFNIIQIQKKEFNFVENENLELYESDEEDSEIPEIIKKKVNFTK